MSLIVKLVYYSVTIFVVLERGWFEAFGRLTMTYPELSQVGATAEIVCTINSSALTWRLNDTILAVVRRSHELVVRKLGPYFRYAIDARIDGIGVSSRLRIVDTICADDGNVFKCREDSKELNKMHVAVEESRVVVVANATRMVTISAQHCPHDIVDCDYCSRWDSTQSYVATRRPDEYFSVTCSAAVPSLAGTNIFRWYTQPHKHYKLERVDDPTPIRDSPGRKCRDTIDMSSTITLVAPKILNTDSRKFRIKCVVDFVRGEQVDRREATATICVTDRIPVKSFELIVPKGKLNTILITVGVVLSVSMAIAFPIVMYRHCSRVADKHLETLYGSLLRRTTVDESWTRPEMVEVYMWLRRWSKKSSTASPRLSASTPDVKRSRSLSDPDDRRKSLDY